MKKHLLPDDKPLDLILQGFYYSTITFAMFVLCTSLALEAVSWLTH